MEPAEAVLKFLQSIGRGNEADFYIRLFRSTAPERFATLMINASTLTEGMNTVVGDLRFLHSLGLTPVVVIGLHWSKDVNANGKRLHDKLMDAGVPSAVSSSDLPTLVDHTHAGRIPIVPLAGGTEEERYLSLGALVAALQTRKLIFVRKEGGLRIGGDWVPNVNLSQELEALRSHPDLSMRQRSLVTHSAKLLFEQVSHRLTVGIVSPLNLLHELFTVKGAGTLLHRGAKINVFDGLKDVDQPRLVELLTSSFGRAPDPDFFNSPIDRAYIEENYQGAALMRNVPLGGYLTKFAVTREAQGEGVGRDLWRRMAEDYPRVIWRARTKNPIGPWYDTLCDGRVRSDQWTVYFKGIAVADMQAAVQYALDQPVDFPLATPTAEIR